MPPGFNNAEPRRKIYQDQTSESPARRLPDRWNVQKYRCRGRNNPVIHLRMINRVEICAGAGIGRNHQFKMAGEGNCA